GHRFLFAQNRKTFGKKQRKGSVIMIGGKLSFRGFEGKRIHELESARRERTQCFDEKRTRDAASSPRRRDDEAHYQRRFERLAGKRRRLDAQPTKAMREHMAWLGIEPADNAFVVIGDEPLRRADLDSRLHRDAILFR